MHGFCGFFYIKVFCPTFIVGEKTNLFICKCLKQTLIEKVKLVGRAQFGDVDNILTEEEDMWMSK